MQFGRVGFAVAVACAPASPAGATNQQAAFSKEETLEFCSPFSSPDGQRSLSFDEHGKVELTIDTPENITLDKPASGSWQFDSGRGRVIVSFGQMRSEYELFTYDSDDKCILVSGTQSNANLKESWFGGFIDEPPDQ